MIPIVFAFDNNLVIQAAVCISSLMSSAKPTTAYEVFVLHSPDEILDCSYLDKVVQKFPERLKIKYRQVPSGIFDKCFQIRGITVPTYYRLLIPELIPEHNRVIYSDVDVIFRQDLSEVYAMEMGDCYLAGVNNLAHMDDGLRIHYEKELHLDPTNIICAGFLIMDCGRILSDNLIPKFMKLIKNRYKYQDQDIINIVCAGRIKMLAPKYSLLTYTSIHAFENGKDGFLPLWTDTEIAEALQEGNIHYNGQKPWCDWCLNFDLWWFHYKKSPIFDEKFYFNFFYRKLEVYDTLSLWKRIKILVRYFKNGRKTFES